MQMDPEYLLNNILSKGYKKDEDINGEKLELIKSMFEQYCLEFYEKKKDEIWNNFLKKMEKLEEDKEHKEEQEEMIFEEKGPLKPFFNFASEYRKIFDSKKFLQKEIGQKWNNCELVRKIYQNEYIESIKYLSNNKEDNKNDKNDVQNSFRDLLFNEENQEDEVINSLNPQK